MSFDYAETAATAAELLADFGAPVTLTRITPGTYDPATGSTSSTEASITGNGVKLDYEQRFIDGSNILHGDQRVYMDPLIAWAPATGDRLTIGSELFSVIASRPLAPAGICVLHDIQIRK